MIKRPLKGASAVQSLPLKVGMNKRYNYCDTPRRGGGTRQPWEISVRSGRQPKTHESDYTFITSAKRSRQRLCFGGTTEQCLPCQVRDEGRGYVKKASNKDSPLSCLTGDAEKPHIVHITQDKESFFFKYKNKLWYFLVKILEKRNPSPRQAGSPSN